MSEPNAAGHIAFSGTNPAPIAGVSGSNFTVPSGSYAPVFEVSAGIFSPHDGLESSANAFAGVVGPGTYTAAPASPLLVFPPDSQLPPLAPNFIGEVYASKTGTLVPTLAASVDPHPAATSWGIKVGKSLAEKFTVIEGIVLQRVS